MLSRGEEKLVRGLARRKIRESEGLVLVEGLRVVEELLASAVVPRLALVSSSLEDTERGRALREALGARVAVRELGEGELAALSATATHQGVLVVAEMPRPALSAQAVRGGATVLVLDGIQDPGNLGTLARSAAAFGCGLLACLPGTVDPWNPKAVRSAAGALFRFPVVRPDLEALTAWLDEGGFEVVGAEAGGEPVESAALGQRVALVVGNEGAGLSPTVRERCGRLVGVPMARGTESLNVAVAAGILLYLIGRERR